MSELTKRPRSVALLVVFVLAGITATLAESTYDMAFANTALAQSDKVLAVGLIYFAGYLTEAVASATMGAKIDAWGPLRAMTIFTGAVAVVLAAAGAVGTLLGVTSVVFLVLLAAVVDYLNQLGGIAHSAALPEAFDGDPNGLIRFSGIDASVRSVAAVATPVLAGFIIIAAPGLEAMYVVSALYATGYALLIGFLIHVANRRRAAIAAAPPPQSATADGEADGPIRLRAVASTILESSSWRRFLVVDVIGTVGLSTALLLVYALLVHDYSFTPATAGIILGLMAGGSLVASVLIARGEPEGLGQLFGLGTLSSAVGVLALALSGGQLLIAGAGACILGFGSILQMKGMTLIVQLNAPRRRVGSWFAVIDGLEQGVNAAAIIAAAFLMDVVGGSVVFGAVALLMGGAGLWWMRNLGRTDLSANAREDVLDSPRL